MELFVASLLYDFWGIVSMFWVIGQINSVEQK